MADLELVDIEQIEEAKAYSARELQMLLNHRGFEAACQATERRIIKEWEQGQQPLEREMAWHKLKAFRTLKSELRAYRDGKP